MTSLLPSFEPSASDLIDLALSVPLERKISKAVSLLQEFQPDDDFWVCDSYGKDSGVIVHLCKLAGVRFVAHHNITGIDPPELIQFGKKYRPETVLHRPQKHMVLTRMVEKAYPPTRCGRWCCAEYKEHGGDGHSKVIGVRIAESARRAGLWKLVNTNQRGGTIIAPIAYWTDSDVWAFHKLYDLPYCSLYDEGFSRLGCVGCPLAGSKRQKEEFKRWPKIEAIWKEGFRRLWVRWHGVPNRKGVPRFFERFGSADSFFEWWLSGVAFHEDNQCVFEEMMTGYSGGLQEGGDQ